MVEEFKMREKIKKKYRLKKPKFNPEEGLLNIYHKAKNAWDADRFDLFVQENGKIVRNFEIQLSKPDIKHKGYKQKLLREAMKFQEFGIIASLYYLAIELIIEGTLNNDVPMLNKAIELMEASFKESQREEFKFGKKFGVMVQKKIAELKKHIEKFNLGEI